VRFQHHLFPPTEGLYLHARLHSNVRVLLRHIGVKRPVWPGSVQEPFFPLWLPPPCFQKSRASVLPPPNDRHNKSPTARASQGFLVSSRRTNSRTGQILHSCIIDGDGHLNFQTVPLFRTRLCWLGRRKQSPGTSNPLPGPLWLSRDLTLGSDRGTLDSFFLSVSSSCQHQDEGSGALTNRLPQARWFPGGCGRTRQM
jgi:hypothetical protein